MGPDVSIPAVDAEGSAGVRPVVGQDRYSRQRAERTFDQSALSAGPLFWFAGRQADPLAGHAFMLAAGMGAVRQTIASSDSGSLDLGTVARSMTLSPWLYPDIVPDEIALQLIEALIQSGERPYALVRVDSDTLATAGRLEALKRDAPNLAVRYHLRSAGGVVTGSDFDQVLRRGLDPAAPRLPLVEGEGDLGAHGVLAAAHVLADYLAHVGAWRCPWNHNEPMPRAPDMLAIEEAAPPGRKGSRRARPARNRLRGRALTVVLVGGGGALAHAFLEAVLRDPVIRLSIGRLVLVDPDRYEESNLSRQTLAGGPFNLGMEKAQVTRKELTRLWRQYAATPPEMVSVTERFSPEIFERWRPDVLGLFPDNFRARSAALRAARRFPGCLVLAAGTEFSLGWARTVQVGGRTSACLDCGPEMLRQAAEQEEQDEQRGAGGNASCAAEITPSNVLTNAIAGATAAVHLRRYLVQPGYRPDPYQVLINWALPERAIAGPRLPGCRCKRERTAA
jgi:hypothetical protein